MPCYPGGSFNLGLPRALTRPSPICMKFGLYVAWVRKTPFSKFYGNPTGGFRDVDL